MNLSAFGRAVRQLRLDYGKKLKDLATYLDVSESYVSSVEFQRRSIPEDWPGRIAKFFGLDFTKTERLDLLARSSNKTLNINFDDEALSQEHKEFAVELAQRLPTYSEEQIRHFRQLLLEQRVNEPWRTSVSTTSNTTRD